MKEHVERLWRRLSGVAGAARITATNDDGVVHKVQIVFHDGQFRDATPSLGLFGVASHAPVGSDVAYLAIGGDRSNVVVIATGNQGDRPTGSNPGEVCLYNAAGMKVFMSLGGIRIDGAGQPVVITNTPKLRVEAPIESTGEITAQVDGAAVHATLHTHGGVQSGGGSTGEPQG